MHSHVWGSHRAKFDDDDFNNFGGIACEGQTHTHTHFIHRHAHTLTQTDSGLSTLKFAQFAYDFANKNRNTYSEEVTQSLKDTHTL